jgi:hypothetical protein
VGLGLALDRLHVLCVAGHWAPPYYPICHYVNVHLYNAIISQNVRLVKM